MPWCEECARFYNPNTLRPDGTCPQHHLVAAPDSDPAAGAERESVKTSIPWHFWLLLLAMALYLGWRVVQLVLWLVG
jgi:hypothetical protein